jgi:hypothetical protein
MEAYCVKCKRKRLMNDGKEVKLKTGTRAMKGCCSTCGTGMMRILGR